jgi:hypothetical protein
MWLFLASIIAFLCATSPTIGDDGLDGAATRKLSRSADQPYMDWLPADSESLIVVRTPYTILAKPENPAASQRRPSGIAFHEMTFNGMFEHHVRDVFVGKTIDVWVEASTRFRFRDLPCDVGHVSTTGLGLKYDGCYIVVFAEQSPVPQKELFRRLLQQHSGNTSPTVRPAVLHQIGQHDAIEYTPQHLHGARTRAAAETPEMTRKIDTAWATTYWLAVPRPNTLLIATTRSCLTETLRKMGDPDQLAFPESLEEWEYVSPDAPIRGIRHFQEPIGKTDFSDPRHSTGYDATG